MLGRGGWHHWPLGHLHGTRGRLWALALASESSLTNEINTKYIVLSDAQSVLPFNNKHTLQSYFLYLIQVLEHIGKEKT